MLTFLQTSVLIGLAGVAIPILIHLFARRKVQRVYFSSVAFLKKIHTQRMRRMKLRQWLLLLLRALAVLFFVLAFARPTMKSVRRADRAGASSAVVLVDRSMSMGGEELFSRARAKAGSVLALMGDEDEAALIWVGGNTDEMMSFARDPGRLEKRIEGEAVTLNRSLFADPLRAGIDLLSAAGSLNREVFLIGDLQASGFEGMADSAFDAFDGWEGNLFILPLIRAVENAAITDCGIDNRLLQPGVPLRVFTTVKNYGNRKVENLLIRFWMNERAVAQEEIDLDPGEERRVTFRVMPEEAGWLRGMFRLDEDALPADDERFFSSWIPERIRVLLVGSADDDVQPFKRGLRPAAGRSRTSFEIEEAVQGAGWIGKLKDADVVILSNLLLSNQTEAEALHRFVKEGGGLFLWMGDATDLRSMKEVLEPAGVLAGNVHGGSGGFLTFESVDYGHPLFQGVFEEGGASVHSPRFFKFVELLTGAPGRIASLDGGHPWLVERKLGKGRLLVTATGIGEAWTDLAYTTFFAPLIVRGVLFLAAPEVEPAAPLVGDPLRWDLPAESVTADYRVVDPDGGARLLLPEVSAGRIRLSAGAADRSGFYELYRGESLVGVRAVNVDPAESDLRSAFGEDLETFLPGAQHVVVQEDDDLESVVKRVRWGREYWREMLLLGFLCLVVEMVVAREGKKKRTQ